MLLVLGLKIERVGEREKEAAWGSTVTGTGQVFPLSVVVGRKGLWADSVSGFDSGWKGWTSPLTKIQSANPNLDPE